MGCDQLQDMSVAVHIDIDGSARFIPEHRQIDEPHSKGVTAEQQGIPVLSGLPKQRRSGDGVQASFLREPMHQLKASVFAGIHFLQRDDIGVEFFEHAKDSLRIIAPIPADARMDVIRGEAQTHD